MDRDRATAETTERVTSLRSTRQENLAYAYQGVLTGVVRLQAKRQSMGDPEKFRSRMKTALHDIRREAATLGYSAEDLKDAEFAAVAFLDEVILTSDERGRESWAKQTLGVELYGEASAGDVFFERLESFKSRRDSQHLADLLEVFLLCLLLGFEGRYAGMKGEIHSTIDRLRRRIDGIRQPDLRLAPGLVQPANSPAPARAPVPQFSNWRFVILISGAAALAVFLLLKLHLLWLGGRVAEYLGS